MSTTIDAPNDIALVEPSGLWAPWATEPGVYPAVGEVEYHRDFVVGGSLSSTGARTITQRTPAHFAYERRHGRADRRVFDMGRAAHRLNLGKGAPIHRMSFDDYRKKDAQTERDTARARGETPLVPKDHDTVLAMAQAMRDDPEYGPLLAAPGVAEQVMVYRDPDTGVMCRVMADYMPTTPPGAPVVVVDYKSSASADPDEFARAAARYGYHQQHPWYLDGPIQLGMCGDVDPVFWFLVQEKTPPYLCSLVQLDEESVEAGRHANRLARQRYATCVASGRWPGYSGAEPGEPSVVSLPSWALRDYRDYCEAVEAGADPDSWERGPDPADEPDYFDFDDPEEGWF